MKRHPRQVLAFAVATLMALGGLTVPEARGERLKKTAAARQPIPSASIQTIAENGFRKGTENFGVTLGLGLGAKIFGTDKRHDLGLATCHWGKIATALIGEDSWYQGNLERWGELVGGLQYHPRDSYVIGCAIGLRYHFITGSRWTPFLDAGMGMAATDIGEPDLGSSFEFNIQFGGGIHYFINEKTALGVQARWFHLSNGGLTRTNHGTNSFVCLCGLTWFF
jgi:lipid A 3-O-deacylase